ncbi:hypothetical protein DFJ73DRAFT_303848 [Zopfochytrium polystomum]|nr:hypothetical protein DFJ73DRAFT_303848 [Zopfochytrium polystomum]
MSSPFSFFGTGIGLGLGDFHLGGNGTNANSSSNSSAALQQQHQQQQQQHPQVSATPGNNPAGTTSPFRMNSSSGVPATVPSNASNPSGSSGTYYRIQLFPHRERIGIPGQMPIISSGFNFAPIEKDVKVGSTIRIGRKVDRRANPTTSAAPVPPLPPNAPASPAALSGSQHPVAAGSDSEAADVSANGFSSTEEVSSGADLSSSAPAASASASVLEHFRRRNSANAPPNAAGHDLGNASTADAGASSDVIPASDFIAFRSKVVSRTHAEMWVTPAGQLLFRDVGSSSGTFLNRVRLSQSGRESRPFTVKSGDVIQLGVDYQGRQEEVYKCVMMKVFISVKAREKPKVNPLRLRTALRALLAAMNPNAQDPTDATSTDCCICLSSMAPQQSLFLAPCSHCFHYRCVMPLLDSTVMFQCPLCRQVANLVPLPSEEEEAVEDEFCAAIAIPSDDDRSSPPVSNDVAVSDSSSSSNAQPMGSQPASQGVAVNPANTQHSDSDQMEGTERANARPRTLFLSESLQTDTGMHSPTSDNGSADSGAALDHQLLREPIVALNASSTLTTALRSSAPPSPNPPSEVLDLIKSASSLINGVAQGGLLSNLMTDQQKADLSDILRRMEQFQLVASGGNSAVTGSNGSSASATADDDNGPISSDDRHFQSEPLGRDALSLSDDELGRKRTDSQRAEQRSRATSGPGTRMSWSPSGSSADAAASAAAGLESDSGGGASSATDASASTSSASSPTSGGAPREKKGKGKGLTSAFAALTGSGRVVKT